jgi:hypothetical protein
MIHFTLPETVKKTISSRDRASVNSDEVLAFTERPRADPAGDASRINPHELFSLFTANIIGENTSFTR